MAEFGLANEKLFEKILKLFGKELSICSNRHVSYDIQLPIVFFFTRQEK